MAKPLVVIGHRMGKGQRIAKGIEEEGGEAVVKVPEGTKCQTKFRLKGKGMPILNSGGKRGDMIVKVSVDMPKPTNQEEKDLYLKLDKILKDKEIKTENSFFRKWFK